MKYVLSAQDYSFFESAQGESLKRLVNGVPASIWESLDSINLSLDTEPTYESSCHQEMLLENFELEHISEYEKCLMFAGKNSLELFTPESYAIAVDQAFAVYEGFWDTATEFLKAITEGGSAIGILHLILDIIGLIPGSWVGFPIDVVANLLNAMIYAGRGMWFLAILSAISAIPANYIGKTLKLTLTPFTKILDKLGIAIFKADTAAVKIASAELKSAAGVEKASKLAEGLSGLVNFLKGGFVSILKSLGWALDKAIQAVTFGFVKGDNVVKFIEKNIEVPLMKAVTGSEEAIKVLKSGDKELEIAAKDGVVGATKKEAGEIANKFNKLGIGDGDMLKAIENSETYIAMTKKGANKAALDAYTTAAAARMSFDKAMKTGEKILSDPKLEKILKAADKTIDSKTLVKAINSGDAAMVEKFFKTAAENPKILKSLSEGEAAVVKVYSKFPEEFIKHGKQFDNYLVTLTRIGKQYAYREKIGRRLLLFWGKQIAKAIMSSNCYKQWSSALMSTGGNPEELKKLAATQVLNEATDPTREQVRAEIMKQYEINEADLTPEANKEIDAMVDEVINKAPAGKKAGDCGLGSSATNAVVGSKTYNPGLYGDDNRYGEKTLTNSDYDKLNNTSETLLKDLNLDSEIEALHDKTASDPMNQLYFSDVYDAETGELIANDDKSRIDQVGKQLLKEGKVKNQAQLQDMINKVKKHWNDGTEPESVTNAIDSLNTNESVSINNSKFMDFEKFLKTQS